MSNLTCAVNAMARMIAFMLLLAGCNQAPTPSSVAASNKSEAIATPPTTMADDCDEGDIACEERLYQLEETLFAYETLVGQRLPDEAQSCWKADVDAFRQRLEACDGMACKEPALFERISSLHEFQPTAQRVSFELPVVPALIAVLPPSPEETPATATASFEAQGALIHATEHPEHMGIAVQANDDQHVFIFEMDMGNLGQDEVLGLVGTSPTTQVLVRGVAKPAPTGINNFDTSHCRWVYQLPGAPE